MEQDKIVEAIQTVGDKIESSIYLSGLLLSAAIMFNACVQS